MGGIVASSVSETIETLKRRLDGAGYLFFRDFGESDGVLMFLDRFGSHRVQDGARPYYIVKAGEVLQPKDGGLLMPHTDDFNTQMPPRLVALYCVDPGIGEGGETLIADGYEWLSRLTEGAGAVRLLQKKWSYRRGDTFVELPFVSFSPSGETIMRVSFGHLQYTHHEQMVGVMSGLREWFYRAALSVSYERGSLLISNNWRMVHGRTAYVDLSRELHRYYLD